MARTVTLEEKIAKDEEQARRNAATEGLDEEATQKAVDQAVAIVKAAYEKSEKEKAAKEKPSAWMITVKNNPKFCGIGAGGIQFANGKARVTSERMAEWFREHEGYEVSIE